MEIKFYNAFLPLVSYDGSISIPVTNSRLNISTRTEKNENTFSFHDYSCNLIKENKIIQNFISKMPIEVNSLSSYISLNIKSADDVSALYFLAFTSVISKYLDIGNLQNIIIKSMENKNLGSSFLSGNLCIDNDIFVIKEGFLALIYKEHDKLINSHIFLKNKINGLEKCIEQKFKYNNRHVFICDSYDVENLKINMQDFDCENIICL